MESKQEISNKRKDWIIDDNDFKKYSKELEELKPTFMLMLLPAIEKAPRWEPWESLKQRFDASLMEGFQKETRIKLADLQTYESKTKQERVNICKDLINLFIKRRLQDILYQMNTGKAVLKDDKYMLTAYNIRVNKSEVTI